MADKRLWALIGLALLAMAAFLGWGLRGNLAFVLELRAWRLLALVQVAVAVAVSTVLLQTVTGNRILSPAILGIDALYTLGLTLLVFLLGGIGFAGLDAHVKFAAALTVMTGAALLIFLPLLRDRQSLYWLLLTGAMLGILFRSLSALLARLIDPNDFMVLQGATYANFGQVRGDLTAIGAGITGAIILLVWRQRHVLDVMALGRATAVGLGVNWSRSLILLLTAIVLLVAVSTALVGPITFLGLLVVALAERCIGTQRHARLLPAAGAVAIATLVGGQAVLQHGFGNAATLGVIVEFLGGLVFLALLLTGAKR
ncbi:iron ABC transporter permease [Elstera litoralis]|uniref:Iron ABC transporter permease n=1 Tax=Elstera litoralis TaxID=552518 RepID=A0A0F3IVI1_9PROT|nr:iron chelate uptake ABC transporter family permease subunit [Elstera litoralis]KJV10548.1 iron ABC transporter permease [Elstera litoralis]